MTEAKQKVKLPYAKSYTSIFDMFGTISYRNMFQLGNNCIPAQEQSVFHVTCGDSTKQSMDRDYSLTKNTDFVTSEKYHSLNRESSCKTVVPSTSTIFYDLDDIAKRHSFNCITELSISNTNCIPIIKKHTNPHGFGAKSDAIVQECATQIQPKLLPRDSRALLASRKIKKTLSKVAVLSSEIFLRDDDYLNDAQKVNFYKDMNERQQQRFWSYAKYRTEYTKPKPEEKKAKKKDRGKRTEDPCPCQLFSYACPCTDKKSLTELKYSKSLIVDQETSTNMETSEEKRNFNYNSSNKPKKSKRQSVKEDKLTNTSLVKMIEQDVPTTEPEIHCPGKEDPVPSDQNNKSNKKIKSRKKPKKILCPNCKENVEVVISISNTEEEESLKYEQSSIYRSKEIPSSTAYAYRASPKNERSKTMEDLCLHDPRCELLPVCQILPNDNISYNASQKSPKKQSSPKSSPRIIRITRACRHHPPCTVVPSCQRANVLKNNCEYIPPCLHHPRCVNLPLCVPFTKSLHYEEVNNKPLDDVGSDCPHVPRCKYIPVCQHDSLTNTLDHQINMVSRVQNACEFLHEYPPAFLVNPNNTCVTNTLSPFQFSPSPCFGEQFVICRSNKSCQFDSSHCKYETKEDPSTEAVVFIRDVGCQFRNKTYSPKGSILRSKMSSNSFNFVDVKMDNYFTNIHTLRYEDKSTTPLSGVEPSFSTGSITSGDQNSESRSYGQRGARCSQKHRPTTGFIPQSAYVAAFSTRMETISKASIQGCRASSSAAPAKPRKHFIKGKYRKIFSMKRRRKLRISNHTFNGSLKSSVCEQSTSL